MEQLHSLATAVFLSFICMAFVCSSNLKFNHFKRHDDMTNKVYSHGLLKEVQVKGKIGCVTQCENHKDCNNVLFNRESSLCRLYGLDADQTEDHAGWQCWTAIVCGDAPQLQAMNVESVTSKTYKSTILYSCALGYKVTTGDGISTCQHTGIWSTPTLTCDPIPNIITSASLSAGPVQLTCSTKQIPIDNPMQACEEDELLVGCSASFKFQPTGTLGVEIVEENGKAHCKLRHVGVDVAASARCCKLKGLGCEYLRSGPSQPDDDQSATVKCYKDFSLLGCSAHINDGTIDGGKMTSTSCSSYRGTHGSAGVFTAAVCCKAPGLSCKIIQTSPPISNGEMRVTCPAGQVLTGCTVLNKWLQAHGSYISDDNGEPTCHGVTGDDRTQVYLSCCTM